jgi:DNA-directed RNA polymerase specialized sigma24 family protein
MRVFREVITDPRDRDIFWRREVSGQEFREIAAATGGKLGSTWARYHAIRKRLGLK